MSLCGKIYNHNSAQRLRRSYSNRKQKKPFHRSRKAFILNDKYYLLSANNFSPKAM
ncbi:MAG: hypothetical protein K0S23_1592 [Fluviicola sp.]|jgi:hypothetical protein|nr:hypothetical protein [Fluviicola sp.]